MNDFNSMAINIPEPVAEAAKAPLGKMLQAGHQVKEVADSHYKGGVAAAAFETFESMSADDFKMATVSAKKGK